MRGESWLRLMSGLVLAGVFAAGTLFGVGIVRLTSRATTSSPAVQRSGPIEAIKHELALDAQQRGALDAITAARHAELEGIGRETQHRVRKLLFAIEDELASKLRPDQVEKLSQWRKNRGPAQGGLP
jgi:hypothetical protein